MLEEEDRKEIIKLQEATHTSVIAFVLSLFIPFIGLILGLKAKSEIDKSEHTKSGSAFATAAIWIGAIGTLAWAALIALIFLVAVTGPSDSWRRGGIFEHRGMMNYQSLGGGMMDPYLYDQNQSGQGQVTPAPGMMDGLGNSGATPGSSGQTNNG